MAIRAVNLEVLILLLYGHYGLLLSFELCIDLLEHRRRRLPVDLLPLAVRMRSPRVEDAHFGVEQRM